MTKSLLYESFAAVVHRYRNELAARDTQQAWSFQKLADEADGVAAALRKHGVGPGAVAPIVVRNTVETLALIIGVLQTGAAFAPIDHRTPAARVRDIVRQCQSTVLLNYSHTEPTTATKFDGHHRAWLTGAIQKVSGTEPVRDLALDTAQKILAYVMFTSGSTGTPKGVMVSQDSVLHYLDWAMAEYEISAGIGAPVFSSLAFDLSVTSTFGPLLNGRLVDFFDDDRWLLPFLNEPHSFAAYSFLKATPSHLSLICRALQPEGITVPIRLIIAGGEALYGETVRRWRAVFPEARFVNEYGPTEATVGCARYWVPPQCPPGPVPIGLAAPGTVLTVRDDRGHRTDGRGELHIGGEQLAAGYLGAPGATSGAFRTVDDASGIEYRTGDFVVPGTGDAGYVFVGRADDQAKVNGHRVDLLEIDSVIRANPGVTDAAVVVDDRHDVDSVIAFVTTRAGHGHVDAETIRIAAATHLPPYMVPNEVRVIGGFPLSRSGKVDRLQLKERYLR